jgi:flagellar hook-associated protein 1 FlgK
VAVLLNGETPLLLEDRKYDLAATLEVPADDAVAYPEAPPGAHILAADGTDITAKTTGGQLGALLRMRNEVLPSYIGDAYQAGDLNTMAKAFADRVNQLLLSGYVSDDDPPVQGAALFQYDTTNDTRAAQSLQVDQSVTADQLGSIDPGPPYVFNGIPLALAALAAPQKDEDRIDGASYSAYYGAMAARAGSALNEARDQLQVRQGTVAQAKNLREDMSGVSLDQEATVLIQFQRAYEANSRFITVLNQLSETVINILQR